MKSNPSNILFSSSVLGFDTFTVFFTLCGKTSSLRLASRAVSYLGTSGYSVVPSSSVLISSPFSFAASSAAFFASSAAWTAWSLSASRASFSA